MRIVLDIESNGLLNSHIESENATRLHCMCYYDIDTGESKSITNEGVMLMFFATHSDLTIIGHKIQTYDIPLLEKLLDIKINARLVDTLGLSWYLYPNRIKHGLEEWGEDLGIAKPPVVDWNNEPIEVYLNRCQEDVKINTKLWNIQLEYLSKIYNNDMAAVGRFINYISFKLDCAREQEEVKFRCDIPKAKENLEFLVKEKTKKIDILSEIMPKHNLYRVVSKPKVMHKKDGSLSSHGEKWLEKLKEQGLPDYHNGALKLVTKTEKGNPGSHQQLKDWLFSLGWQPTTFKYVKEETKTDIVNQEGTYIPMNKQTVRAVPQLSADDGTGICPSVQELYEKEPKLEELEDLFIINHRIGILEGFLEKADNNGFLKAEIKGLTNTLRFQHAKPIVNLPTIPKKHWEKIRECLIAPDENHLLCGSDMSGLEDNCKQHYMYFFDPQYVTELRTEGFDPHLDIAVLGGLLTHEQAEEHKLYEKTKGQQGKSYKAVRLKAKKTNFAAVYGAGAPKIALTANIPLKEAQILHTTYWKRNKAVKLVAENARKKTVDGNMWLYNPVSKFWYSLRFDKDAFSTINQSTGVFCFDTWVKHIRQSGVKISMQYHDEVVFPIINSIESKNRCTFVLKDAIDKTNQELKLNVELNISIEYGTDYSKIH